MDREVAFATEKHKTQRRKNAAKTPYIEHPLEVRDLLLDAGVEDSVTLMAAVLHDTVEDTNTTLEEIEQYFGDDVAAVVAECTDDKSLPKVTRKRLQIAHASHASREARLVKLADKLSNCRALRTDPPTTWSPEVIEGYLDWSFAVTRQMFDANVVLADQLKAVFGDTRLRLTDAELEARLEHYYSLIN